MSVWSYAGKRVVIAGCFSGMGEAAARELVELGAEVHGFDIRESSVPLKSFHKIDLKDPASIDAAAASMDGPIDALFNCAGLPQTFPALDVMKVNFLGLRQWTEALLPKMRAGGAICSISSVAGMGWPMHVAECKELIATPDFASGVKWCEAHPDLVGDGYSFSKEALNIWTMIQGTKLIKNNIRINATLPGPTQTPMMPDFEKHSGANLIDVFTTPSDRRSSPAEQAYPVVFLNSDAATYINGHLLNVDGGFLGGVSAGEIDVQALLASLA